MAEPLAPSLVRPASLRLYELAARAASPLAPLWLAARVWRGKEDPARLGERLGNASCDRPDGPLIWMHGASVGEGLSLLPLASGLMAQRPDAHVLVTTGTRTSAEILGRRLPAGAVHQYAPLDTPGAVTRFLRHWRPDIGVLVESELWPNLILAARRSGTRMALVSARMSPGSFRNWKRVGRAAHTILGAFDLILPRDAAAALHFRGLGGHPQELTDMKWGAPPLPVDADALARLRAGLAHRRVLVAASTHAGEETLILSAFADIGRDVARPLLVLVPRHPGRGLQVEALARQAGWDVTRRAAGQNPGDANVHVADTLGELGLWYRLAAMAIIGGSFVTGVGGHNPLEPARLDCPFVSGSHVENWPIYAAMEATGATCRLETLNALGKWLQKAMQGDGSLTRMAKQARSFVDALDQQNQTVAIRLAGMLAQ